MKKLLFALLAFMVTSVYAEEITLTATDYKTSVYSYMEGSHWSDGLAPHAGNNYTTGSGSLGLYVRLPKDDDESLTFGGDKLTVNSNGHVYFDWYSYPAGMTYLDYPIYIDHLVLTGYSSQLRFSDSSNAAVATAKYLLQGKLEVTGVLTKWPAIIRLGKFSGNWAYSEMELVGESKAYLQIETCNTITGLGQAIADANDKTKVSETAMVGIDFNGELAGYQGVIMVGTNVAVRIGGVMENGKVVLSGAQSAVGSSAEFGGVLKTLECRNKGILLASPKYEQLYVTESFTKNGKMKVRLFDGGEDIMYRDRVNVITVPISAGITASDFELEEPSDALTLEVIDEGETLTLSIVNAMPVDEFDPIGYVQLYEDDQREFFSPKTDTDPDLFQLYSYHFAGNWDNGEKPTADNDYYVGPGRRFYFCNAGTLAGARDVEEGFKEDYYWQHIFFYGKSLTIGGIGFFNVPDSSSNGYSMTIPDLRLLSGAKFTFSKKDGSVGNPYQARFGYHSGRGIMKVTVEAKKVWPVVFESGSQGKDCGGYLFEKYTKFIGESDAGIKLVGSVSKPTDRGWTAFIGDMSEYYGTIMLGERQNLILGTDSMPGKIEVLASATEGIIISNTVNVVSLGGLTTHGALNVTLRGNVKLAIGESQFGGIVNFICDNFKPGDIVAGSGATIDNVRVNGQQVKVLSGSGALYLNDVSELGIEGTGTKTDPYVIGSADIRAILASAKGEKIYTLPAEALPVEGEYNNTRRDTYIAKYRGYYVDNYNADSTVMFMMDTGEDAYSSVGHFTGEIGKVAGVTVPFWSDELAPHAGADYVVYPEVWSSTIHEKYITVKPSMGDFGGDSLMLVDGSKLKMSGTGIDTTINKLILMPGGAIENRADVGSESYIRGALYVRGSLISPSQIICGLHRQVLHFPGVVAAPADGVLRIAADSEKVQRPAVQFDGDLSGYKGTIQVGRNAIAKFATDALNATVTCIQFSTGIEIVSDATIKSLTMIDGNTLALKAPLKIAEDFFYSGSLTVDMSGFRAAESGTVVLELPEGDVIDKNDFEFINLPTGASVSISGNKAILLGGVGPMPTKKGTVILFQ